MYAKSILKEEMLRLEKLLKRLKEKIRKLPRGQFQKRIGVERNIIIGPAAKMKELFLNI